MNKKLIRNIAMAIVAVIAVALILMLVGNKMEGNAIKSQQEAQNYSNWLSDNCKCLQYNRPYCKDAGFELAGSFCFNPALNQSTSRIRGCSQYNCSGEIKTWNNVTWEN